MINFPEINAYPGVSCNFAMVGIQKHLEWKKISIILINNENMTPIEAEDTSFTVLVVSETKTAKEIEFHFFQCASNKETNFTLTKG